MMINFKKIYDDLKNTLENSKKKKIIENCVLIIVIGAIAIIAGSIFFPAVNDKDEIANNKIKDNQISMQSDVDGNLEIENKIAGILSQINGAGKVNVIITYSTSKEIVPAYDLKKNENDTQEKDNTGIDRNVSQRDVENQIAYEEVSGVKKPIVLKEILPQIRGVVVVAEGANNDFVKENIFSAVEVLLDVPVEKIQVLKRKK